MSDPRHAPNVRYHAALRELLNMMDRKAKSEEARAGVLKAQSMITISNSVSLYNIADTALPFFYRYNEKIVNRDESFFETECNNLASTETDPTVASLMLAIKTMYVTSNKTDKDRAYLLVRELLDSVIAYGIAAATMPAK
jgi:hypothetical protein